MQLLVAYQRALNRKPLLTQMASAGVIGCCGDALSQLFVERVQPTGFDFTRSARFFLLPALYIAPVLGQWFRLLEKVKGSARIVPLKKLVIDQVCFAPIFSASIIFNLRVLEGYSPRESMEKLKRDYWSIYRRSIQVCLSNGLFRVLYQLALQYWPVVQLCNFYLMPLNFQVVFVQLAALLWNVFLSHQTQSQRKLSIPPLE